MLMMLKEIRQAAHRFAAYRHTARELRRLPLDTALDLDIHASDADTIARRAVYGR